MRAALGIVLIAFALVQGSMEFIMGKGNVLTVIAMILIIFVGAVAILSQSLGRDKPYD